MSLVPMPLKTPYVSEQGSFFLAAIAVGGIVVLSLFGKPVPDVLDRAAFASIIFFFGHANGTKSKSPPENPPAIEIARR